MSNDASLKRQLSKILTIIRAEQHGCMLHSDRLGVPCTECLKVGTALSAKVESMLRLSYVRGHDDQRQQRMSDPERGVIQAVNAYRNG